MSSFSWSDGEGRWGARQIVQQARDRLFANVYTSGRDVSCECEQGVLRLRGRVSSYYQKQIAQEAVRRVDGVVEVVNEIEVTG